MEPAAEGEVEDVGRALGACRRHERTEPRDRVLSDRIDGRDVHPERADAEELLADLRERRERAIERDLARNEAVDRFTRAIVLTEDELRDTRDVFYEDVIRLREREHPGARGERAVPA
jgi:hypothetical protein